MLGRKGSANVQKLQERGGAGTVLETKGGALKRIRITFDVGEDWRVEILRAEGRAEWGFIEYLQRGGGKSTMRSRTRNNVHV